MLQFPQELKSMQPAFTENAITVLKKRYLLPQEDDTLETPQQMLWRIASNIAYAEREYGKSMKQVLELASDYYRIMCLLDFLPNSPTLMNAGVPEGQLSACYVLPVGDSIEGIFDAIKYAAMIHKTGGGTGFSFTHLRPAGSMVRSTNGVASGVISFLKIFDTATEQIKQGGKRRGANMGILNIDHPEIIEFIRAKEVDGVFNNFNLSVGVTDKFMEAVKNHTTYDLIDPHTNLVAKTLKADEVWDLLCNRAWRTGDPGIIFLDTIERCNPTPNEGKLEATNPCGELPLLPYEACNLGSINLSHFCTQFREVDWTTFNKAINLAVRFLDDVIDANCYPLQAIDTQVKRNRKIGLGIMGWADMLYQFNIPYDSDGALTLARQVMKYIKECGRAYSSLLGKTRGSFPTFANSTLVDDYNDMRNATITTIAPTGTISILADCSSGLEPVFALAYKRKAMETEEFTVVNQHFKNALQKRGIYSEDLMQEVIDNGGSCQGIKDIPDDIQRVFVTAMDIKPEWHLRMQATFQEYIDNSISKTINLPNSATVEDIKKIYMDAFDMNCKGVTIYRDGSKYGQVLTTTKTNNEKATFQQENDTKTPTFQKTERPNCLSGWTCRAKTGLGTMYATVNEINGKPFEMFITIGKSGHSVTAKAEAIGRLISLALRHDVDVSEIIGQLKGIGGEHPSFGNGNLTLSIPDAIAHLLEQHYKEENIAVHTVDIDNKTCPECGAPLVRQEGCEHCPQCYYSKCNG